MPLSQHRPAMIYKQHGEAYLQTHQTQHDKKLAKKDVEKKRDRFRRHRSQKIYIDKSRYDLSLQPEHLGIMQVPPIKIYQK